MNACMMQYTPEVDEARPVQLQFRDRSPSGQYSQQFRARFRIVCFTLAGRRILNFPRLDAQLRHQCFEGYLPPASQIRHKHHAPRVRLFNGIGKRD